MMKSLLMGERLALKLEEKAGKNVFPVRARSMKSSPAFS